VCGEPGTFAPRSSGGISAKASRQEAWASLVSIYFANCWRNGLIESGLGVAETGDFERVGFDGAFFAVRMRDLVVFFLLLAMFVSSGARLICDFLPLCSTAALGCGF